jgi:hypothetical protein
MEHVPFFLYSSTLYCNDSTTSLIVRGFRYVCGCYVIKKQERNFTPFIKNLCFAYFKMKLGDQDKKWDPHVVCKTCAENLRQWFKEIRSSMPYGILTVWTQPQNHYNDRYFLCVKYMGTTKKKTRWAFSTQDCHRQSDLCPMDLTLQFLRRHYHRWKFPPLWIQNIMMHIFHQTQEVRIHSF